MDSRSLPSLTRMTRTAGAALAVAVFLLTSCTSSSKPDKNALDDDLVTGSPPNVIVDARTGLPGAARLAAPAGLDISDDQAAGESALDVLGQNKADLGIANPGTDLKLESSRVDSLGVRHVYFDQQHQGLPVYGGEVAVHFPPESNDVLVGNHFVPAVALATVAPTVSAGQATAAAKVELAAGEVAGDPALVVYAGKGSAISGKTARLAWMVNLRDRTIPASNTYVVDASDGALFDVIPRLAHVLDRTIYGQAGAKAPPARREGQPEAADVDVDHAYDFLGMTYDYYMKNHSRDSFDGRGSPIIAHTYLTDKNAYWDSQTNEIWFGKDFTVLDVVAHEFTHGVNQYHTKNGLDYVWQSGALDESFSDVIGAAVDDEDWLSGEDLPDGPGRDLENPERFDQPGHTKDFVKTCDDAEGVHSNSGIPNKAFVNLATDLGDRVAAAQIFFSAIQYLQRNATFEELHYWVYQAAAVDPKHKASQPAIIKAFNAVGLNGQFSPPPNSCSSPTPGLKADDGNTNKPRGGG